MPKTKSWKTNRQRLRKTRANIRAKIRRAKVPFRKAAEKAELDPFSKASKRAASAAALSLEQQVDVTRARKDG